MSTDHDRYYQQVIETCRDCGAPITRYYYAGVPFCGDCREKFRAAKRASLNARRCSVCGRVVPNKKGTNMSEFSDAQDKPIHKKCLPPTGPDVDGERKDHAAGLLGKEGDA